MNAICKKILITDATHPVLAKILESHGFSVDSAPGISKEELLKIIGRYFGVVVRSRLIFDKNLINAATNLRFIARAGSGMESIDVEAATSKNIICINSPEGNRDAVGEHSLGLLLALLHNINKADDEIKNGEWNRKANRVTELKGKTIGIIGYGNTGSSFASKLKGFGVNILAYDKYKSGYSDDFVNESSLADIYANCDIVSFHVPLTEETTYYANKNFFNNFTKNIIIINTSRGPVINTNDLAEAIENGKVRGAGLDVIEYEGTAFESLKFSDSPAAYQYLCKSYNVIMTPHVAGLSQESEERHATVLAEKIINTFI